MMPRDVQADGIWSVSEAAEGAIAKAIDTFAHDYAASDMDDHYPLVSWRSGGSYWKGPSAPKPLRDQYDLSLMKRKDVSGAFDWIKIKSHRFGYVIFVPREEDAASNRRLIDFVGNKIVVRRAMRDPA